MIRKRMLQFILLMMMLIVMSGCSSKKEENNVSWENYYNTTLFISNYVLKTGEYSSTMAQITKDNSGSIGKTSTVDFTEFDGFTELYNEVISDTSEFSAYDITGFPDGLRNYYNKAYELSSLTKKYYTSINRRVTCDEFEDLLIEYSENCTDIYSELATLQAKAELEYKNSIGDTEGVNELNSKIKGSADSEGFYEIYDSDSEIVKKTKLYLDTSAFSYDGLVSQLQYEGYSEKEAKDAIDSISVDWKKQSLKYAEAYLNSSAFSFNGLQEQLMYSGFSEDEAWYGAFYSNADWKEQAVKKARSYMEISKFSRDDLINQLLYEGFTKEEAEYAVDKVGL